MYIIYDTDSNIETLRSKYLLLELDTVEIIDREIKVYALIDQEHISFDEIAKLDSIKDLHEALIRNYRKKNWDFCFEAIGHLKGTFKGEIDSFYDTISERITKFKDQDLPETWTGNIIAKTE